MPAVCAGRLPEQAFLRRFQHDGAYTDCYHTEVARQISQADYIEAFYTSWLFKIERWLLARLVARPSTDAQARQLSEGTLDRFAAWSVERQDAEQLLLCDFRGRTRSWLMALPTPGEPSRTRLYFGSAVVAVRDSAGRSRLGFAFAVLLGFHKLYSRALLGCASRRITRAAPR